MGTMRLSTWVLTWGLVAGAAAAPPSLQLDATDWHRLLSASVDRPVALRTDATHAWTASPMDVYAADARIELVRATAQ